MKKLILVLLVLIGGIARGEVVIPRGVSLGLLVGAETTLAIDALQTTWGQRNNEWESNPILGRHPSDLAIVGYFGAAMVVTWALWQFLPPVWREIAAVVIIGVESWTIGRNASWDVGLKIPFT